MKPIYIKTLIIPHLQKSVWGMFILIFGLVMGIFLCTLKSLYTYSDHQCYLKLLNCEKEEPVTNIYFKLTFYEPRCQFISCTHPLFSSKQVSLRHKTRNVYSFVLYKNYTCNSLLVIEKPTLKCLLNAVNIMPLVIQYWYIAYMYLCHFLTLESLLIYC